jgi:hypothetical protein
MSDSVGTYAHSGNPGWTRHCGVWGTLANTWPCADRVFSHALNTVNKIRTGSQKPPSATRLKLYGLYKQAMGTLPLARTALGA